MVANSITKLTDEAVVPAFVLIVGKTLGFIAASYLFNLSFTLTESRLFGILPQVSFQNTQDYVTAENYSNLAMFTAAALGTVFVLIRAHYFHKSHIHPSLHAKLVSLNLESLVAPSYHLYHQAAIWLIFLWLTTAFIMTSTIILHITSPVISAIAFLTTTNFSWLFALDIEKEVELSKEA